MSRATSFITPVVQTNSAYTKIGTQTNGISLYNLRLGGSTGDKLFNFACPGDQIVTGLKVNSGSIVDSIAGLTCAKPGDLNNTTRTYVNGVVTGGTPSEFTCPTGSGVSFLKGYWSGTNPLQGLEAGCSNMTGNPTGSKKWGNTSILTNASSPLENKTAFVSSFKGTYGNYIDSVDVGYKDISDGLLALTTDLGKRKACNNELPPDFSTLTKAECDIFMGKSCQGNTEPRCSCYNSKIIDTFQKQDPMFPNCPHIYDPTCQLNGYKSDALKNITQCSYLNCPINVINSNLNNTDIKNVCSSSGAPTPSTVSNTPSYLSLGTILILLVMLLLFAVYKKESLPSTRQSQSGLI